MVRTGSDPAGLIVSADGLIASYSLQGCVPNVLKMAPAAAITFVVYEQVWISAENLFRLTTAGGKWILTTGCVAAIVFPMVAQIMSLLRDMRKEKGGEPELQHHGAKPPLPTAEKQ